MTGNPEPTNAQAEIEILKKALRRIIYGMTNSDNRVWPTVKPWTKKERDEAIIYVAREALEKTNRGDA